MTTSIVICVLENRLSKEKINRAKQSSWFLVFADFFGASIPIMISGYQSNIADSRVKKKYVQLIPLNK